MAIYSIKDLEKLSGIKAHTIRIWEQRYKIMSPKRTKTNIRYYDDHDLKKLLNIALLNRHGLKISKISEMSKDQIMEKVSEVAEISLESSSQLDALLLSMMEMDEGKFDRIINANIQQLGFEDTMIQVIYPFLDKLGMLWLTGSISPVQENFISLLIRQKIVVAIDRIGNREPSTNQKVFLTYLPKGERQELSILFIHYLIKSRGHRVVYIGQDIPNEDLEDACRILSPDYLFTLIMETFSHESVDHYVESVLSSVPFSTKLILSGYQVVAQQVEPRNRLVMLKNLQDTLVFLENI